MEEDGGVLNEADQEGRDVETAPSEGHLGEYGTGGEAKDEEPVHALRDGEVEEHEDAATKNAVHLEIEDNFGAGVASIFVKFPDTGVSASGEEGAGDSGPGVEVEGIVVPHLKDNGGAYDDGYHRRDKVS